ncbi:LiaI-LiaF-like domain-containing protein [Sphingobacterium paludis]|jgi:hypothetical protein|uniref:LiaI-LiaF-like transmembrane region domain-containing protein n=1 Tax=Sphingobacterium paludis TaxID=1476465 RepID=A0A4V3E2D0_9SPHI|nr:DUF5668 domain-containing protein [Sphingobacterium paludis]TDS15988.1 hypothetical protein B0I21_102310 [Sphingobacterium paludis]
MENKITSGIWFVFIGLILLLHNIDVIDFNFIATLKYWPLLIVIVGINLMVQNRVYGNYIKIACNVIFLGWLTYVGLTKPSTHWASDLLNNKDIKIGDLDDRDPLVQQVESALDDSASEAKLEFNGGAGKFSVNSSDISQLITAKSDDDKMGMNIKSSLNSGKQIVVLNAKPITDGKKTGMVSIHLNATPLWDFEFNYGAATIDGDLSALRFKNLAINTGASNMDLKLGMPEVERSKINIATGASKIHFSIPKEAAISVKYSSILSKNAFEGFATKKNGKAKTANYDEATKKFDIELDGAANTFTITRY